jgi:hypothetical protein
VGLAVRAGAAEPRPGIVQRGREMIQAACHRHSEPEAVAAPAACDTCDKDAARIGKLITILQTDPKAHRRKWAADELDDYRWQDHPEIVAALLGAMQSDCDPSVRDEAADSLKDMKACTPEVLAAMQFSARADNNKWVRSEARSDIRKLQKTQPPVLTYVSGYGPSRAGEAVPKTTPELAPPPVPGAEPELEPAPAGPRPEPMPMPASDDKPTEAKRRPVRSAISTAVAKLRPRS